MASRKNFENRKKARKDSAKVRQEAYDKLSFEQKLQKAVPGSKEHDKLVYKCEKDAR
jgi:hypothetical protein